ncbi:MAG: hypothetical protein U0802_13610 [Candidatus Binatia bacterium]
MQRSGVHLSGAGAHRRVEHRALPVRWHGGASRGYLQHRFSDISTCSPTTSPSFRLRAERVLAALETTRWELRIDLREERFVRCELSDEDVALKIELVNDVPARVGQVQHHSILGRLASAENIFANKITALVDRQEPKDLADVWGFSVRLGLSLDDALQGAQGKAVGVFAPAVARVLAGATTDDWALVRWIDGPSADAFTADLRRLADQLILGG